MIDLPFEAAWSKAAVRYAGMSVVIFVSFLFLACAIGRHKRRNWVEAAQNNSPPRLPPLGNLFLRLRHHLARRRRIQIVLLFLLMMMAALAEVFSIGAVLPFVGVLTAPETVFRYPLVQQFATFWGLQPDRSLMLPLTAVFIASALTAGAIRLLLLWLTLRVTAVVGCDLAVETFRRTLYQPYATHAASNSSSVISAINLKIHYVVSGVLMPALQVTSGSILLVAIMSAIVLVDAGVALTAAFVVSVIYLLISVGTRRYLKRNSEITAQSSTRALKIVQEGLGGIRDVILGGTQTLYTQLFREADFAVRRAQGNSAFIGGTPRFVMEAAGMSLIAALGYALSSTPEGIARALPVLGALALGAQRLLPALQQAYSGWSTISSHWAALRDILDLLERPVREGCLDPDPPPLEFERDIRLQNVSFRYQPAMPDVLSGIEFTIGKKARVGIVGATGSGKSTLADILMGLLEPTTGKILVDGQALCGGRRRAWQKIIAHVPQNVYLTDTTVAENIAFGVLPGDIDMERVAQAARRAQIADYIESCPNGYRTMVGERGIRLSGGQRQRIGIARALYRQAKVLVFDEATSALDSATEDAVMNGLETLNDDLTIIMIAHRITTLRNCSQIIRVENTGIRSIGSYKHLVKSSPGLDWTINQDKVDAE